MRIVNLTRELYCRFEGEYPEMTIRGIAALDGDDVVGILGITTVKSANFVICGIGKVSSRNIIKAWRYFVKNFMDERLVYYSILDEEIETAQSFNNHFGFVHLKDNIYIKRF